MDPLSLTLEIPSSTYPSQTLSHVPISTPNFTISDQIPNISSLNPQTPTVSTGAPLQTLLVPKPEPFDDIFAAQGSQQQPRFPPGYEPNDQSNLYAKYEHNLQLFNSTFNESLYPFLRIDESNNAHDFSMENFLNVSHLGQTSNPNMGVDYVDDRNDQAIVVVPEKQDLSAKVGEVGKKASQVMELVRVSDLNIKDQMHFRMVMRRTRMIYDSLRVLANIEEEKRMVEERKLAAKVDVEEESKLVEEGILDTKVAVMEDEMRVVEENRMIGVAGVDGEMLNGRRRRNRPRYDVVAATLMKNRGLYLYREKRIVGAIPGVYVGDVFLYRRELCVIGLHMQIQAGIDYLPKSKCYNGEPIATSVVVSGGYEDDVEWEDGGVLIYTGHGGKDMNSSKQICDQKLEAGNLAMERSMHYKIEIRVIRGMKYEGIASNSGKIYVYDGLYKIVDLSYDVGKSGFRVYKYALRRIEGQPKMGSAILKDAMEMKKNGFNFKPMFCLSVDISNNRENVPVRLFNDIDDNQEPLYYEYLPSTSFPQFVFHQSGKTTGCECVKSCTDGCFCSMKNGGEFPYNLQGFLVRGKPFLFECGPFCSCPPYCQNRVAQKGVKCRLEVFRSAQTGWGVRSLDLIEAGTFICEYAGVILTREQAHILTMNGDSLIYPNRFSERWVEWGDLSRIYTNYVRPSYPSIPPLDFSLDVSTMRNVACYMSHSSSPNVFVQYVLYDHNNLMFPHVMLYAMENIPPMRELSIDYGIPDEWRASCLYLCN